MAGSPRRRAGRALPTPRLLSTCADSRSRGTGAPGARARPGPRAPASPGAGPASRSAGRGGGRAARRRSRRRAGRGRARSARRRTARDGAGRERAPASGAPAPAGRGTSANPATSRLNRTGSRSDIPCPAPGTVTSVPAVSSATRTPLGRHDLVAVAVHHQHRARHGPAHRLRLGRAEPGPGGRRRVEGRGVGLQRPADPVLPLLGRVRLGEHPREERLGPSRWSTRHDGPAGSW